MQRIGFRYIVETRVTLTGRELLVLFDTARIHYDGMCRAAAEQAVHAGYGGELWGILNRFVYEDTTPDSLEPTLRCGPHSEDESQVALFRRVCTEYPDATVEVVLNNETLSRLGKISELAAGSNEARTILARLNGEVYAAIRAAGEEWKRVNPTE